MVRDALMNVVESLRARRMLCAVFAVALVLIGLPVAGLIGLPIVGPRLAVAQALDNGLGRTPMMGWANWNVFGCNYTYKTIEQEAEMLATTGLAADGYNMVRIQECIFEPYRDSNGNLIPRPERFPAGHTLKDVINYVHKLGLKVSIYTDAGTYTCAGSVNGSSGSYGHEEQDVNYFVNTLGVNMIEEDTCNLPMSDYPPGTTPAQVLQALDTKMSNDIVATGKPVEYYTFAGNSSAFSNFGTWAPSVANFYRVSPDIEASWASVMNNFTALEANASTSGPGAFGDGDMLETGNPGLTATEGRSMFSLWCMESSPLSISTDLLNPNDFTSATRETLGNRAMIAIDQDSLGKPAQVVSNNNAGLQVLAKPLSNGDVAVAFLNNSATATTMSTTAAALGLPASERYTVRDLWTHQTTLSAGRVSSSVHSHEVTVYRVAPVAGGAGVAPATGLWLASSSRYVSPGSPAVITATLRNNAPVAIEGITAHVTAPAGVTATPLGSSGAPALAPGATATWRWQLSVTPSGETGALAELSVHASYEAGAVPGSVDGWLDFAPGSPPTASGERVDTTTQGNWQGTYGTQGYDIAGDSEQLPAGTSISTDGALYVWDPAPTDPRALQRASGPGRIAATFYGGTFHITVDVNGGAARRVSFYLLDWDGATSGAGLRDESVTATDPFGNTLAEADSGTFTNGEYLSWNVSGAVTFTFQVESGANAVVSGIFSDPAT